MKAMRVFRTVVLAAMFLGQVAGKAATLTFEKFSPGMDHFPIPAGYGGLTWFNFEVLNGKNQGFRTGYRHGMISPNNVIFNAFGDPAAIACGEPFKLQSAYVTAAVIDGLSLNVKGFLGGEPLYNETYALSVDSPTFIEFNFEGVDRVEFSTTPGSQIAIDDLTVEAPAAAPENEPVNSTESQPPIDLGRIVVSSIGKLTLNPPIESEIAVTGPNYYLIDQAGYSTGALLPNIDVNWDTNTAFSVTFAAPEGKKFLVSTPPNSMAQFGAFLWWETGDRGGFSGSGYVSVTFENLEGDSPNFYESDAVLSSSHGFFGIADLESTPIVSDLAFTAMTIVGHISPQVIDVGTQTFVPHHECSLLVHDMGGGAALSLIPTDDHQVLAASALPKVTISRDAQGAPVLYFTGILQSATSLGGPFNDVPGNPQTGYKIPAGSSLFYRVRTQAGLAAFE